MIRNTLQSFALALQNIRSNLFHTFFSVLGIVIGVAALVATFSLIDGLELFARKQISTQTSVNAVVVRTETDKQINGLSIRKDSFPILEYDRYVRFRAGLSEVTRSSLHNQFNRGIKVEGQDTLIGAMIQGISENPSSDTMLAFGAMLNPDVFPQRRAEVMVNTRLAKLIAGEPAAAVGRRFSVLGRSLQITGVVKDKKSESPPVAYLPISLFTQEELKASPPDLLLEVGKTEEVEPLKTKINAWLAQEYPTQFKEFEVLSQDFWIKQTTQGFIIFRIIMGLVIGISVVVGGVGVMNVLLISVNERTAEIGLRKAVGAKKSDIRRLFLAESITVSAFGSFVGLVLGALFAMAVMPIVRLFADVPFNAALTWNTFLIISVIAVIVGIIFGTYPAVKAARLDPVEALRHE